MRIISVHLKNIKSHRDREFTFSPGINVLSGSNGSGKSTIFEAIGYALFGVSAQDFVSKADRFLTIGTKKGEISVVFEPAPGEMYRVTRTVGAAGKWLLARENDGSFEIEEHANAQETEDRIATLLGLATGRSLADQFKLVIGPFQNDFLGPFVIKQPTKRQDAFDEILGIDTWRKTFDGTKTLASVINGKIETLQAEVAGKQEQVAVLPEKERELHALLEQRGSKQAELRKASTSLEQVRGAIQLLDAQKGRIDAVKQELQATEERIASGREHVATQQLQVDQARTAAALMTAAAKGKKGYDAAEELLTQLRLREKEKASLERRLADLHREQAALKSALEIEARELAEARKGMEEEGRRLDAEDVSFAASLRELKEAEAAAAQALAQVKRQELLFRELPMHRVEGSLPYLELTLDRIAALDAQAKDRKEMLSGGAALKTEAADLPARQARLEQVQARRSELCGRRLSLAEGREKIGSGDCPYFHEPCRNLESGDPTALFDARIADIDAEIAKLDAEAAALAAQVAAAQAAARELAGLELVAQELEKAGKERDQLEADFSGRLADLSPAALIEPLKEWLAATGLTVSVAAGDTEFGVAMAAAPKERREQLGKVAKGWQRVISDLEQLLGERVRQAGVPVQECAVKLAELSARGEAVQRRRCELQNAGEKAALREQAVQAKGEKVAQLTESVAKQQSELVAYDGLDEAIAKASADVARLQPERDSYIANEKAAGELDKRLETLDRYQARLRELEELLGKKREELEGQVAEYQAQRHEEAKRESEQLVSAVATLNAEIVAIADGVARLEGETAALKAVAAEIETKAAAIEKLKEQGVLVKFLRNQVFKNVSSQLSERFREEISFRADRIYRSICASDEELLWGENYQVVLKDMAEGEIRERTDDQLSGGQMMSAVVALRLALLQTIGARVAFFDEPTSNLDAERRENLARAFRAIDVGQEEVTEHWYDQLFLVSHDVSFTEITDQTIQLD